MPDKKTTAWKNLTEKGAEGDYSDLVAPLDYLILEQIHQEGEMFAGLYPIGDTAKEMTLRLKGLPKNTAISRMQMLCRLGLTVKINNLRSGDQAYQRTKKGKEVLDAWRKENPAAKTTGS